MIITEPIPIVDLFAGPGGLGEGFSSFKNSTAFKILISAEMDESAHATLRLRAFYRILKRHNLLDDYYAYCHGKTSQPYSEKTEIYWVEASTEAQKMTLGVMEDDAKLEQIIKSADLSADKPWVLIGGPPCQAYSLVGRSRNLGKVNYRAEDDKRHYLYKEYLKIIRNFQPAVFVMENVKGILSSKIDGKKIFPSILQDLSDPHHDIGSQNNIGYKIYSLTLPTAYDRTVKFDELKLTDFVIKSEDYGIPQARHRVILLGVREDIKNPPSLINRTDKVLVKDVIKDLPKIRSSLTKEIDSSLNWTNIVIKHLNSLLTESELSEDLVALSSALKSAIKNFNCNLEVGHLRKPKIKSSTTLEKQLSDWYCDGNLEVWLNHEARGHMPSDLKRYIFASCFAQAFRRSPKGHLDFMLNDLSPEHKNWKSGKFSDRFRVQIYNKPSTTITSHISKDGHYFIHPDPLQCRSLTVREAARLQTFPDNYFFQGNRTSQFHQVGNAVPPLLAAKIAEIVFNVLK